SERDRMSPLRVLAGQAFSRAAGAPLVPGNRLRILKDAAENYPAWLEAIGSARDHIFFENYIFNEDEIGRQFASALASKAREGVRVRLIYDWMGSSRGASRRFWKRLRESGVEVRCFNPPHLDSPFGWLSRDHRKMISVDSRVGFVTGVCVSRKWATPPGGKVDPWRDTGVEIEGPAVADIEQAFSETWAACGAPLPAEELPSTRESIAAAGDTALRIVASSPNLAGVYRLDQLVAAVARQSMWLTDAYFVGTTAYIQALRAAAMDGVDVRLLVPRSSDLPLVGALSRVGFRPLLEAGVRVFEWNGPMLHAKTAVADGRWARVGSTNLNLASWIGNWELDVVAEDEPFAQDMEQMYLDDLAHSTEIVLGPQRRLRLSQDPPSSAPRTRRAAGSGGRAARGVLTLGSTVGAAVVRHRTLGPAEWAIMVDAGLLLLALAAVAIFWPRVIAYPLALLGAWIAVSLLVYAYRLRSRRKG
ncbi:MAG TPA: phospholipase D-like domain-containing protein, partial [Terriglobia bacterium]|nr:phospholipase D-like domain-containing protein [Terriglobia bacterium]